jgi:DNA polymerase
LENLDVTDELRSCLRNLRQLIELELGFGIDVVPVAKGGMVAERPDAVAPPPAPLTVPNAPAKPPPPAPPPATGRRRETTADPPAARPPAGPAITTLAAWPEPDFGGDAAERLATVAEKISTCTRCPLAKTRTNTVPGEGNPKASLLFIGEGPGADEDAQGRPFVGAAGHLLDKMITAMGLRRDEVYITNLVKCRPPNNRTPTTEEAIVCGPWLAEQIAAISPRVICSLGAAAFKALRGDDTLGIIKHRGNPFTYRDITVVPTFHPSYLLRNESAKKPTWNDLRQVLALIGREPPARR